MDQQEIHQNMPLTLGDDGTIRIKGSRVSLEVIVQQFKQGATAEQLLEDFPSLTFRLAEGLGRRKKLSRKWGRKLPNEECSILRFRSMQLPANSLAYTVRSWRRSLPKGWTLTSMH
jgi:hypothetical protein